MKKLCFLLAVMLLLAGCGQTAQPETPATTGPQSAETGRMVSFDIYAVNDLHGRLADTEAQPGVDELSTYLKQARQAGNTILLSTGDMWQGAYESNLTQGASVTEWMNHMAFDAMTIGGHEYDWGEEVIRQNDDLAEFPFLAINIYSRETDTLADYCQGSVLVELDGAQIGIIGAAGDYTSSISAENLQNVYFKTGAALTELVKAESEALRSRGADFIVYCIHAGTDQTSTGTTPLELDSQAIAEYYDTALSQGFVDLVFEADSHYWYSFIDQAGVHHLQAGANNQGISHARVMIDTVSGDSYILAAELLPDSKYTHLDDDPIVSQLLKKYAADIAPGTEILGYNSQYKNNKSLSQLVANLYCAKGVEKWGQDYDIVLGGGYISCRSPMYMPEGEVTYGQVLSLLPFDNQITLCSIRGSDLLSKFLETDHYAYYIKTTPYGDSIRGSIDPEGIYYVVTDTYSANYAPNNMTIIDTYDDNIFARDLLAEYIAAGGLG